eukprot:scpid31748/ scgid8722/ LIM domain only protein 7; F-box only protein 20; LOMP
MDVGDVLSVERDCQDWIEAMTGCYFEKESFRESLQDGVLLCKLLNAIKRGAVTKINTRQGTFANIENLNAFIAACKSLGIPPTALFAPSDIQAPPATSVSLRRRQSQLEAQRREDDKRVRNVLVTLYWLNQKAMAMPGYNGPQLATENYSLLMKDPWASPAKSATLGRIQKPPPSGVVIDSLDSNEVTGLRRATLPRAASPSFYGQSSSRSPVSDRSRSPLSSTSSHATAHSYSSRASTSSIDGSVRGSSPADSIASPVSSASAPISRPIRQSPSPDSAPSTHRLSTGGTIMFSPRQRALQAVFDLTEDPLDSVSVEMPPSAQQSGGKRSVSITSASWQKEPQCTVSERPYTMSIPPTTPQVTDGGKLASADTTLSTEPSAGRARSDSGIAFLTSPVVTMTITGSAVSDSDSNDDAPRRLENVSSSRSQPRSTASPLANGQPAGRYSKISEQPATASMPSMPLQQPKHVDLYPTPSPDTSQSPSPDLFVPPSTKAAQQKPPPASQSHSRWTKEQPASVQMPKPAWQTSKQPHFTPASAVHTQDLQSTRPTAQTTTSSYSSGGTAASTLPRSFGANSASGASSKAITQDDSRVNSGPPPPPKRDTAADTMRSQIIASHSQASRFTPSPPAARAAPAYDTMAQPIPEPSKVTTDNRTDEDIIATLQSEIMADLENFAPPSRADPPSPASQIDGAGPTAKDVPLQVDTEYLQETSEPIPDEVVLPAITAQATTVPAPTVQEALKPKAVVTVRKSSLSKSFSFGSGGDTQRLIAEEQKWRASRRRSELAKQVDMLLDDQFLLKNVSQPLSSSGSSRDGSEAFLDAAASDARLQEQQQLKLLQGKAKHSPSALSATAPATQRPASAMGYLHDDYTASSNGGGSGRMEQDATPAPPGQLRSSRLASPASPLDLATSIDEDRSEMERLLSLAEQERSQQLQAAEEHRRMSMDQREEMTKKKREKVLRNLVKDRKMREEKDREKRWEKLEAERQRQLEEEEEEEARQLSGEIAIVRGSQEDVGTSATDGGDEGETEDGNDDGGSGGEDRNAVEEIDDEPIWGDLPARSEPSSEIDTAAPEDYSAEPDNTREDSQADHAIEENRTTSHDCVSTTEDNDQGTNDDDSAVTHGDCPIENAMITPQEDTKNNGRSGVVGDVSISSILDPLASAIESIAQGQTEKRRSITRLSASSFTRSPLRSPHVSGTALNKESPPPAKPPRPPVIVEVDPARRISSARTSSTTSHASVSSTEMTDSAVGSPSSSLNISNEAGSADMSRYFGSALKDFCGDEDDEDDEDAELVNEPVDQGMAGVFTEV